uniref:Dynein axonemal assembly factor 4 n=1 Tax=Hippocampus comes TaxID=109280 RepID=A0A3Q3E0D8_HIPCM
MPLLVTDHSWTQTESMVFISVPLKGAKKVDIVSSDEYLKVHFPPFLLEVFPSELVDDEQSSAKIGNGVAVISLTKRTNKLWEHLSISTYDKETKREVRERALSKMQEKLAKELKKGHPTPVSLCSPQWLKKQAEARRVVSADIEELNDLREEERNPDWLKEKGKYVKPAPINNSSLSPSL